MQNFTGRRRRSRPRQGGGGRRHHLPPNRWWRHLCTSWPIPTAKHGLGNHGHSNHGRGVTPCVNCPLLRRRTPHAPPPTSFPPPHRSGSAGVSYAPIRTHSLARTVICRSRFGRLRAVGACGPLPPNVRQCSSAATAWSCARAHAHTRQRCWMMAAMLLDVVATLLDVGSAAAEIRITVPHVHRQVTWRKDGKDRGIAEWAVPTKPRLVGGKDRILFIHGGAYERVHQKLSAAFTDGAACFWKAPPLFRFARCGRSVAWTTRTTWTTWADSEASCINTCGCIAIVFDDCLVPGANPILHCYPTASHQLPTLF
jgi:hypothetical protein